MKYTVTEYHNLLSPWWRSMMDPLSSTTLVYKLLEYLIEQKYGEWIYDDNTFSEYKRPPCHESASFVMIFNDGSDVYKCEASYIKNNLEYIFDKIDDELIKYAGKVN